MLDSDLYKLTMQNAILELYPDATAEYVFINRNKNYIFDRKFCNTLRDEIDRMPNLKLGLDEKDWLRNQCPYLKPAYLEYLSNYRFNPNEVDVSIKDSQLVLSIYGKWFQTVLWEVPLMAIISELYFESVKGWNYDGQKELAREKGRRLSETGCKFADFGTRRRRSFRTQFDLIDVFRNSGNSCPGFVGTSNPYLAFKFGVTPMGTIAHEFIQAESVLNGLRHANRFAMNDWASVYKASLGTALPDTYGTDAFLEDFSLYHAKLWDGVRQDSGDPFKFTDKIVEHYKKLRIDPMSKTIVFSDSLDVDKAIKLKEYCKNKIKCSFGIGTNFTNSFSDGKYLNMVIKLSKINGIPVVKLSEDPGKAIGDPDAIKVAKWTFFRKPL